MSEDEFEKLLQLDDNFESKFVSSEIEKKWRKLPKNFSLIYLGETCFFYILITFWMIIASIGKWFLNVD